MPRCRSPAMALAANPSAKTRFSPTAIGWTKPSATAPLRLKMSPPPNWANCGGIDTALEDLAASCDAERVEDDGQDRPPQRTARSRR